MSIQSVSPASSSSNDLFSLFGGSNASAGSGANGSTSLGTDSIGSGNQQLLLQILLLELEMLLEQLQSSDGTGNAQGSTSGNGTGGWSPQLGDSSGSSGGSGSTGGGSGAASSGSTDGTSGSTTAPAVPQDGNIVQVAASQIGVTASSSDRNADPNGADGPIHGYQSTTGAYDAAWCASFVSWALDKSDAPTDFRSASVDRFVDEARSGGDNLHAVDASQMKPGDLIAFDWSGSNFGDGDTHIGIVSKVNGDGSFDYISGNSGAGVVSQESDRITASNTDARSAHVQVIRVGK